MERPALLEMQNITKEFPGVKALDGVSLTVRPGTVHALMGENGAGKSTLMKCLFGIYNKDSGTILLDGKEVNFKSSKEALENGVAMVHQELNQGYQITKQVEDLPEEQREQAAQEALDILRAKKEIQEKDAEIDREGKIAGVFCKAYEKAVLLDPTEENVRIWAKCTRMTRDEMEDTVKESRELAEVFRTIADLMERLLPERGTL